MCACTILEWKTFSQRSLAPLSPEGLAQGETLRTTKVTQCEISNLEWNECLKGIITSKEMIKSK